MQLKFSGQIERVSPTGDFAIRAYVGDMAVRCVVERSAVTAGFGERYMSDTELLRLFAARRYEFEAIASQHFFNGERAPVVKRRHLSH